MVVADTVDDGDGVPVEAGVTVTAEVDDGVTVTALVLDGVTVRAAVPEGVFDGDGTVWTLDHTNAVGTIARGVEKLDQYNTQFAAPAP